MILNNVQTSKWWGTFVPVLLRTLPLTKKAVVEMGAGLISTNLLHWICRENGQKLITYENVDEYFEYARTFRSMGHRVVKVNDWNEISPKKDWGILLLDHHPDFRVKDLIRFKDSADYIIVHDTNKVEQFGFTEDVWNLFKYRYTCKEHTPWTTIVSNKIDLSKIPAFKQK